MTGISKLGSLRGNQVLDSARPEHVVPMRVLTEEPEDMYSNLRSFSFGNPSEQEEELSATEAKSPETGKEI